MMELSKVKIKENITRIWFEEEVKPYKVRVFSSRFLICTKPYNPQRTVFYTIIDLKKNIRGPESLVFQMGAETDNDCIDMLKRLESETSEISYRNNIEVKIKKIKNIESILKKDKENS